MFVRKAKMSDLDRIMEIYAAAKAYMDKTGNPTQWKPGYPNRAMIEEDIRLGRCYVCESEAGLHGVFAFIIGEDDTYKHIYEGEWRRDETYGTIHRIASDGSKRGVFKTAFEYCKGKILYLRIDTHKDNVIMQRLIEESGFKRAGIIYVADGTPRLAYEYLDVLKIQTKN